MESLRFGRVEACALLHTQFSVGLCVQGFSVATPRFTPLICVGLPSPIPGSTTLTEIRHNLNLATLASSTSLGVHTRVGVA